MGKKYKIISDILGFDFIERAEYLISVLKIPRNAIKEKKLFEKEKIIEETLNSGSTASNPKIITRKDVEYLLEKLFF